jgi:hypothetical protein
MTESCDSPPSRGLIAVLAQRGWQAAAGALTLALVAHFLTPVEQGYFYTLAGIAALYMALDMGLSTALVQLSAREFGGLAWGPGGTVMGATRPRFLALGRLSLRWYGGAALAFLLIYPLGAAYIGEGVGDLGYEWRPAWAILVCATAAGLVFLPALALVEGSGNVGEAYAVRLAQGVAGAVAAWLILARGGGLYAVCAAPLAGLAVGCAWVLAKRRRTVSALLREGSNSFPWRVEVWPFQWRIAASWLSGYVLVLMHAPLLFRTQGAVAAGRMGLTMTVANMLGMLALAWITARVPEMARLASNRDWARLDIVYWRTFRLSLFAFATGAAAFMLLRAALEWTEYGARFLSVIETAGVVAAAGFYHAALMFAMYLRTHAREPFVWPSLLGAALTFAAVVYVAPRWGSAGIVVVLVVMNALFFLPVSVYLWLRLRREWHRT